jgi:hypothetical protein
MEPVEASARPKLPARVPATELDRKSPHQPKDSAPIAPGNLISAEVKSSRMGSFSVTITNMPMGAAITGSGKASSAQQSSAEWIAEASYGARFTASGFQLGLLRVRLYRADRHLLCEYRRRDWTNRIVCIQSKPRLDHDEHQRGCCESGAPSVSQTAQAFLSHG